MGTNLLIARQRRKKDRKKSILDILYVNVSVVKNRGGGGINGV